MAREIEEDVLKEHFDKHKARFSKPKTWHVREIILAGTGEHRLTAWQEANEVMNQARAGASFADLARHCSVAPSAGEGGDLGSLTLRETTGRGPEFQRCLFSLGEGEISDVTRIDQGYLILKLESISEPVPQSYEEAKELVRADYLEKNWSAFAADMREQQLREVGFRCFVESE